ncbi:diguanylate cyclase [Synergistales bacterium]|nr:diguanylate cyclase [Synergistales bacterium]
MSESDVLNDYNNVENVLSMRNSFSAEDELLSFIKNINDILILVSEDRKIIAASDSANKLMGIQSGNYSELTIDRFFPPMYINMMFTRPGNNAGTAVQPMSFAMTGKHGQNTQIEVCFNWHKLSGRDVLVLSCRDISLYSAIIDDLTEREDQYRTLFHNTPLGLIHIDSDCYIKDCNDAFLSIFGFTKLDVFNVCLSEDSPINFYREFINAAIDSVCGTSSTHESDFTTPDGRMIWVRVTFSPVSSDSNVFLGAIGIVEDITEAKSAQSEIAFMSSHDILTGLYNRASCEDTLRMIDKLELFPLSVIYADLNGLKLANDAFGHEEGDRLLKSAARIMTNNVRSSDLVYRYGGDEFIIVLRGADLKIALQKAESITQSCLVWKEECFVLPSMAMGCAAKTTPGQPVAELMKDAEDNMYANKLQMGKANRSRILGVIEGKLRALSGGAVGRRCDRIMAWGEWAARNMEIMCSSEYLLLLCRYHDIGLLVSPEELDIIQRDPIEADKAYPLQHIAIGYRIARSVTEISSIADAILTHHEWWAAEGQTSAQDSDSDIPYAARLVHIIDTVEAMASLPAPAPSWDEIFRSVKACAGRQFDPRLTEEFLGRVAKAPPEELIGK